MNELPYSKRRQLGKDFYTADEFREMMLSEDDLQTAFDQYLLRTGWVRPGSIGQDNATKTVRGIFFHIPNEIFLRKKTPINANLKNLPDTMLLHPDGRFKAIELKSKKGKRSRGQRALGKIIPIEEHRVFEKIIKSVEDWYERRN